jgi:glucose/arabinose dehydrogenase
MGERSVAWTIALSLTVAACLESDPVLPPVIGDPFAPGSWSVERIADADRPTQASWGPDGRLYVAGFNGIITALTFDETYVLQDLREIATLQFEPNRAILGIAINPREAPNPVRIYVSHSPLLTALCGDDPRPYLGQVSVLTGPDFDTFEPVVTGLPSSTRTHGVNGIAFDARGDLLIAVGGQTNAGVPSCDVGGLPESPLSGAILHARTSDPKFSGRIRYVNRTDGLENGDQQRAEDVDLAPGSGVSVLAAGLRNPFDLVITASGAVYATDNGPNEAAGPASLSATTEGPNPVAPDELNRIVDGAYYGHPNRNRGRDDVRQNRYRGSLPTSESGFSQSLRTLPASTNGVLEYTSAVLGPGLRGALVVQQWDQVARFVRLESGGRVVSQVAPLPFEFPALDVVAAPGGALIGTDFTGNAIWLARPLPEVGGRFEIFDVTPDRIDAAFDHRLTVSGAGFTSMAQVMIGGVRTELVEVSPSRVVVMLRGASSMTPGAAAVVVRQGRATTVLEGAIRVLAPM